MSDSDKSSTTLSPCGYPGAISEPSQYRFNPMSVFQMLTSRCISARFASSVARPLPGSAATAEVNQGEERDQQSSQEAITPTSFAATEKEACSSKAGEGEVK